jgi:hypothetical protein
VFTRHSSFVYLVARLNLPNFRRSARLRYINMWLVSPRASALVAASGDGGRANYSATAG